MCTIPIYRGFRRATLTIIVYVIVDTPAIVSVIVDSPANVAHNGRAIRAVSTIRAVDAINGAQV